MNIIQRLFMLSILVMLAGQTLAGSSDDKPINWQGLPEPYATKSFTNGPKVISRPEGAELSVPDGFTIEEFMSGFDSPRFMIEGSKGEILLSDTFVGKVYVIRDSDKKLLISDLNNPYGLAFYKDWLYVAETTAVRRFKYDSETQSISSEGEKVVDMSDLNRGHITRSILFNKKAEKFYLSVGSQSNVDAGEPVMRAAISRFNPDGSDHEIFAAGIRNGVGLRWYPDMDNELWVSSHERDGLGDDLVPDYLSRVNEGDFFGWPYAYIGPHEDPRHAGVAPEQVTKTRYPDVLLGSHVGAMDFVFYTGKQFPEKYQGGCFIALHGSWNRSQRVGYQIAFIPFKNGRPSAGLEDFVTGWMSSPESIKVWGRPVGLLQLEDGSILITDDAAGKIWRVSYSR